MWWTLARAGWDMVYKFGNLAVVLQISIQFKKKKHYLVPGLMVKFTLFCDRDFVQFIGFHPSADECCQNCLETHDV